MASTEEATPMEIDGEGVTLQEEKSLLIPITSSSQPDLQLEIFADELPTLSVMQQVLEDETAPTSLWADAAVLYLQTGKHAEALQLLEKCPPPDNKTDKVRWHASAGICHWVLGDFTKADEAFTAAGKLDTFFPMTWMGRGLLNWSKEKAEQAQFFFQTTLKQCGNVLPALLGMAAVLYQQGEYRQAQGFYEKVIRHHGGDANTRVGFGLCCYQLGQVDRAKAAFARALDMDPENVQAMVAQAVLDMAAVDETAKDFSARTERAIKLMSMANLLDHSNAMVQNHLANHYFWKWTPMPGTVQVSQRSKIVKASQPIPLDIGEPIRIGTSFETAVQEEDAEDASQFVMAAPWTADSAAGLKVWKKDYERVFALAKGAYNSTKVAVIQAESLFFLARVYHVRQDTDNAYKFYKKACELAPDLTPARFGLAQTLVVRGETKEAEKHLQDFLRTAPNPKPTDALALLGLLQAPHTTDSPPALRQARELDPLNPELLVLEAIALQPRSFAKSLEKYQAAVKLMQRNGDPVPVEWYNNMGVLCHETRQWEASLKYFQEGLKRLGSLEPTSKGLPGGTIRQKENDIFWGFVESPVQVVAVPEEKKKEKDDNDEEQKEDSQDSEDKTEENNKTGTKFAKVVSDRASVTEWIVEGEWIRLGDTFSTRVVRTVEKEGDLLIELADSWEQQDDKANNQDEATEVSKTTTTTVYCQRENTLLDLNEATTMAFNIARLHEATGRPLAAIEIHRAITKRNPAYVNSYLRLACIAVDSGALKECSEWLKIAAVSSPGNSEVLTLIGNLHLSLCDWKPAQDVFEGLMGKKIASVEAYANLSMGSIYFETLHVSPLRYAKHLQYASDFYKRILGKDPLNAYAANGLGTVLGEKGEIFKAKEVFNRVREVSEDSIADALLNLGHIYLAQKKHSEALQMYQNFMKRVEDISTPTTSKSRAEELVDVLLYIAFAYFDWARHTELFNDANAAPADGRYKKAMEHLENALSKHVEKREVVLKYNLCMVKLQAANCVLQKLTRNIPRTVEEVEEALHGLEESLVVVQQIFKEKTENLRKVAIRTSTLEDFLKHCRANIVSAQSHLEDERKRAQEEAAEREIRRLAAEATLKEEELKAAIKKEEDAKKQEERDRKAELKMRKVDELRQGWELEQAQQAAEKEKKAKKKSAQDDFIVEDDPQNTGHGLFGDSDDEAEPKDKSNDKEETRTDEKAEPSKKPSSAELFGDSDDDEEDEDEGDAGKEKKEKSDSPSPKKKIEKMGKSDNADEESDNEEFGEAAPAKAATSKELFGDSDDDEESDEELVKPDAKRAGEDDDDDGQPKKKRRVLEEDE